MLSCTLRQLVHCLNVVWNYQRESSAVVPVRRFCLNSIYEVVPCQSRSTLESRVLHLMMFRQVYAVFLNIIFSQIKNDETPFMCRYDRAFSSRTVQMHTHNKPFGSRVYNGKVLFLVQAPRSQVACLVLNVRVLQMIFVRFVTARVSPALLVCN